MSPVVVFTLDDPRYCDGCPCMTTDYEDGADCNLGHWGGSSPYTEVELYKWRYVRPDKCRQLLGT